MICLLNLIIKSLRIYRKFDLNKSEIMFGSLYDYFLLLRYFESEGCKDS